MQYKRKITFRRFGLGLGVYIIQNCPPPSSGECFLTVSIFGKCCEGKLFDNMEIYQFYLILPGPNLKNLSGGLKLSCGSNMVGDA